MEFLALIGLIAIGYFIFNERAKMNGGNKQVSSRPVWDDEQDPLREWTDLE